jgi:Holliday junction resolvase
MESTYQRKLKRYFEREGWLVIKVIRATVNGYPDLMLLHPLRPTIFIEVKAEKGVLSKVQEYRIKELQEKGFTAMVTKPSNYDETIQQVKQTY